MAIQWYPGHMHKASKEIKEVLPQVDLIIEVLDARIPFSSENPMLASLRGDKPCIKALCKSDLADPAITRRWLDNFEQDNHTKALALTTEQPEQMRDLLRLCRKMVPHKIGGSKFIHTLIVGIPNVGKSTLINTLTGRRIAKTGNEPAVTKRQQRIKLGDDIVLSDTPGVLWPNLENRNSGYRLAVTGAVKDTAMEYEDVAMFAVDFLRLSYPEQLKERYQLTELPENELAMLDAIGARRGCLKAGGKVDLNKVSKILLSELRDGVLGRLTLETPETKAVELAELEVIRAEKEAAKEAKKAARKARRKKNR